MVCCGIVLIDGYGLMEINVVIGGVVSVWCLGYMGWLVWGFEVCVVDEYDWLVFDG